MSTYNFKEIQWSKDEIQDSIVRKEKGDKVM
jgi:hypothetical protein